MLVLLEDGGSLETAAGQDTADTVAAAKAAGLEVQTFSGATAAIFGAEDALAHLAVHDPPEPAVWIGYIPEPALYRSVYDALAAKGLQLLNDPDSHLLSMEFHRYYPLIADLTPKSRWVASVEECEAAALDVGFPMFVKGTMQSLKARGWSACVANDKDELRDRVGAILEHGLRSRGHAILRELVELAHVRRSDHGVPFGREFRVFVLHGRSIAHGYYWHGEDELMHLSPDEEQAVLSLAERAASRLPTPFLAIDVGQLRDGRWTVIELGDGQFAAAARASRAALWAGLCAGAAHA